MQPRRAFISYQRADVAWAQALADNLSRYGIDAWWDNSIDPGDDWRERIATALEGADVFIVLHSEAAERSDEVRKEIGAAAALKKPLLAVRLEDRQPRGVFLYELAALSWVDGFRDPTAALDDLARRLARIDLAAGRRTMEQALDVRPMQAPLLQRLLGSSRAMAALWVASFLLVFVTLDAVGLGYSSLATENGATLGDLLYVVGAAAVGAPLLIFRFVLSPPASLAEVVLLIACVLMIASYIFLIRNGLRTLRRASAQRSGGRRP